MEQHVIRQREFEDIIRNHLLWVTTQGAKGEKADFSGCIIEDVHIGQNVPDDAPRLVLSDVSWKGATIRHSDFYHLLLSCNDFTDAQCSDITVADTIANKCAAQGFCADRCDFVGDSLYADDLDESMIQNSLLWDNTVSSCSLRDSYRCNNRIIGTENRMEECNCNGQTLEKILVSSYNEGDERIRPRVTISHCSMKGGGMKDCFLPHLTFQDVSLDGKYVYGNNFNFTSFIRTPTDVALIGANNFERTEFIQSEHTEELVPMTIRLKNRKIPVAYYPRADQFTAYRVFDSLRLTPKEGIAKLKEKPPATLSKDDVQRIISGLHIIHSHRRQMIRNLNHLKGR